MSLGSQYVDGPARVSLAHLERIDWHDHTVHHLIYPRSGVLRISTQTGSWIVPPQRAVWLPACISHAHQAYGHTDLRALTFDRSTNPLGLDRPTVLAVSPLLREVIASLTADNELVGAHRRNLERVVLDQLRRVEALRLCLPHPTDPRLRDIAGILHKDPSDNRTLAGLGAAVGAAERTLARLFRNETGMTFSQWRTQLRLHHSLTLLASGASVTMAAVNCGYSGPSGFIQAFRNAFGVTPGEYSRHDH